MCYIVVLLERVLTEEMQSCLCERYEVGDTLGGVFAVLELRGQLEVDLPSFHSPCHVVRAAPSNLG